MNVRLPAVLLASLALAACGGGSHATVAPPVAGGPSTTSSGPDVSANAPHNAAPAANAVTASVTVQIPLTAHTSARARTPQYLTSSTKGIDLQAFQNGTYSGYVFYALTTQAQYCTSTASALTCTLALQAPIGQSSIVIHTYDNTTVATSNILSVATQTATVTAGQTNTVAVTTAPVAATFQFGTGLPTCFVTGSPANATITYTAYDADGGALTGLELGNTLSLAYVNANQSSPGFTLTPNTLTSGSGSLAVAYNGTDTNLAVYTSSLSLTPTGAANVMQGATGFIPVTTAGPHLVWVADAANDRVYGFDICTANSGNVATTSYALPAGTDAQKIRYDRHSPANDPRLFVVGGNTSADKLLYVDVSTAGTASVLQTVTYGGPVHFVNDSSASSVAFVSFGGANLYKYTINESGPTYLTQAATLTTLNNPRGFNL